MAAAAAVGEVAEQPLPTAANPQVDAAWQKTLTAITPAVVNVRICSVRCIEVENPSYSYATGFISAF